MLWKNQWLCYTLQSLLELLVYAVEPTDIYDYVAVAVVGVRCYAQHAPGVSISNVWLFANVILYVFDVAKW